MMASYADIDITERERETEKERERERNMTDDKRSEQC